MARRSKKKMLRTPKAARRQARKRRSTIAERRKKEFLYRGYNLTELQALPLTAPEDDLEALSVAALMPARVRRTLDKGLPENMQKFLDRLRSETGDIRTHCRSMYVLPEMVGRTIGIHDGQKFVNIQVKPEMMGHALGEFARTRRSVTHTGPGVGATRSSKHVALK